MFCQKKLKKWLTCALCLAMFASFSPNATYADTTTATVRFDNVNVRSGPGLQFSSIGKVNKGNTYTVIKEEDGWIYVSISKEKKGWIANWMMETTEAVEADTPASSSKSSASIESTVTNLNVRSGAGTSYPSIGKINPGTSYALIEESKDWVKIQFDSKQQGWVAKWLVTYKNEAVNNSENTDAKPAPPQSDVFEKKMAKVTATTLFVRKGPGVNHSPLGKLKQNDTIEIIKSENGWHKITYNGSEGWISADYAQIIEQKTQEPTPPETTEDTTEETPEVTPEPIPEAPVEQPATEKDDEQPKVMLLNSGINLREGPGTNHKVITTGEKNDTYPVVEQSGDWYKIALADGNTAYVAGWVVSVVNNGSSNAGNQNQSQTLPNALEGKTIVIDPGHGGRDSGAIGTVYKTHESVVNLAVSKILASKLTALGANVYLTRNDDSYLTLQSRVDLAIAKRADVFVSIHHNTNPRSNINGTIMYYYSNGRDRDLARLVQSEVISRTGLNDMNARYGNFFVLRENPKLSILAELSFLSNRKDEEAARSTHFQEQSAEGIVQGLNKYFNMQ